MTLARFIFCFLFCLSNTTQAINLPLTHRQEIQLVKPATLADKTLGSALSVFGSTAAVAATYPESNRTGTVYLYDALENWQLTTELTSPVMDDNFGRNIALKGNILLVSADRDDNQRGAVYVFERDSTNRHQWQQQAKLTAPDTQDGHQFGRAIMISEDKLYIGAPLHQQGKVYIFSRNERGQWQFDASIIPEDPQALRFGDAIAKEGNTLIIGAPYTNASNSTAKNRPRQPRFTFSKEAVLDLGIENGAIFIYENNDNHWRYHSRLSANNGESGDHFGEQILIEENTILSSVKQKDIFDDLRSGAVYIYTKQTDQWLEEQLLLATKPKVGGFFGQSIAMLKNAILVGASKSDLSGFNSGEVEIFSKNKTPAWETTPWQHPQHLPGHEQFGLSLAVAENYFLVASINSVRVFQDPLTHSSSANFYPQTNELQLDDAYIADSGVFKAHFKLTQKADDLLLTLAHVEIQPDKKMSDIHYSKQTGQLTIPRLAIQNSNQETVFYALTLQHIENSSPLQFRVSSFNAITP
ncbi:MAG: hypothetical protein Q9M50_10530 [Methylococcales bacterium]|nr:hypothetical protein [Methylococcales bacterium]